MKEGKQWEQADGDGEKSTRKGGDLGMEICEQETQEKNPITRKSNTANDKKDYYDRNGI